MLISYDKETLSLFIFVFGFNLCNVKIDEYTKIWQVLKYITAMGRPMHNDIHTSMLLGKFLVPQNIFQKTLRLLILYFVSQNST